MKRLDVLLCAWMLPLASIGCMGEEFAEVDDEVGVDEFRADILSESGEALDGVEQEVGVAEASPPGCNRGAFCAYAGFSATGSLLLETQGNWTGSRGGVLSVFNNGVPFAGADHVQLNWVWADGVADTVCIHYNPGPGTYKFNFDPFFAPVRVTRVRWRGECRPGEDVLSQGPAVDGQLAIERVR